MGPERDGRDDGPWPGRAAVAARLFVLSAALLTAVGALGQAIGWTTLTSTLGPTAYLVLVHPDSVTARVRNAVLGHGAALACALACLAGFDLWDHPPVTVSNEAPWPRIGAQSLAVGGTLVLLTLLRAHHPPAAATALLVASGISRPGPPLYGLLVGLVLTVVLAPALARLPPFRSRTAREHAP
ncbi:hypothetical protein AQ490_19275 [Wenjunlia vitaminophila]|uniref:HPP transmembrane region domain-containing protein n=1 Tax=Wenjunlia vitaminophila TaxID=76728 RepID=A0A0T6LUV2_WENVI|nr:HPP family protein [Wenjunlia vitaminophila]KRV49828.1 hypothetical protein AQ490_19275 [Wenjunlia vitaminophila]